MKLDDAVSELIDILVLLENNVLAVGDNEVDIIVQSRYGDAGIMKHRVGFNRFLVVIASYCAFARLDVR